LASSVELGLGGGVTTVVDGGEAGGGGFIVVCFSHPARAATATTAIAKTDLFI